MRSHSSAQLALLAESGLRGHPNPYLAKHRLTAWGIDFSTKAIDVGILPGADRKDDFVHLRHALPGNGEDEHRLAGAADAIRHLLAQAFIRDLDPPGIVCIEVPIAKGKQRQIMHQLFGAIIGGWASFWNPNDNGQPLLLRAAASSIKAEVYGNGHASKIDAVAWLHDAFAVNGDDNQADALAAAVYARNTEIGVLP
jgi:hypothetical protein